MTTLIEKLESLGAIKCWAPGSEVRYYPRDEFESECKKALIDKGFQRVNWWIDYKTVKITFKCVTDIYGNELNQDEAKEIIKSIITEWVKKS